jgi:ribosome biogenesis GTPase / thiamine phosphate phosphatase
MIDTSNFETLRGVGLTPALMQQLALHQNESHGQQQLTQLTQLMRVVQVQREGVVVHDGTLEHPARLLPALRNSLTAQDDAIAVGDWVLAGRNEHHEWWLHERLAPLNQLARRLSDGRDKITRMVIVSNVDTALLVMGLDHDFSSRRLERFVALAQLAHVTPVVVLSKADLCSNTELRLSQVQTLLPAHAAVVAVNALSVESCALLSPWAQQGQTLVLLGTSGAGKSTLTNTLCQTDVAITQANRAGDSRGRHTTTTRSLHTTPQGACIIDTPGLRTLRLDGDEQALASAFDDIAQLASRCRFRDCRHQGEPGCAVQGGVSSERLKNYNKLLREVQRDNITALERKAQVQLWKARGRNARMRMQAKRG